MTYRIDIPIYCKYLSRKYSHLTIYLECWSFPSKEEIVRKLGMKLDIQHFGLVKEEVLDAIESIKACNWPNGLKRRKHHNCDIVRKEFGRQKLSIDEILVHSIDEERN